MLFQYLLTTKAFKINTLQYTAHTAMAPNPATQSALAKSLQLLINISSPRHLDYVLSGTVNHIS